MLVIIAVILLCFSFAYLSETNAISAYNVLMYQIGINLVLLVALHAMITSFNADIKAAITYTSLRLSTIEVERDSFMRQVDEKLKKHKHFYEDGHAVLDPDF